MKYINIVLFIFLITAVSAQQNKKDPLFFNSYIATNNGAKYTNQTSVSLEIFSTGATHMMLSNRADFNKAKWTPMKNNIQNWNLGQGDGLKEVFITFRFAPKDLQSDVFSAKITLDTTPPENPHIKIDTPSKFLNETDSLSVDLVLSAVDAKYMMISNKRSFYGHKWTIFRNSYPEWQLTEGDDGPRSVFVKFRDKAGNISVAATDMIEVDTRKPSEGRIEINSGEKYSILQNKKVQLVLFARPVDSMMISQNESFENGKWQKYKSTYEWTLEGDDGEKTIYIKYKTKANNVSKTVSDKIILDTTSPKSGNVTIDNGKETTSDDNKLVTLDISVDDAKWMLISNHPSFSGARWRKYQSRVENWKLEGEQDGKRVVYVRFKDDAGNISSIFRGIIKLERGIH